MKRISGVVFLYAIIMTLISSCSKTANNPGGIAANWIGNYSAAGTNDTVNRIAVSQVNSNTVNMAIQVSSDAGHTFYTPVTITNATVLNDSVASFDGYYIANASHTLHVAGSARRAADILTVIATYTDTFAHSSGPYQFRGIR